MVGIEPTRPRGHGLLRPARLPFHHIGIKTVLGLIQVQVVNLIITLLFQPIAGEIIVLRGSATGGSRTRTTFRPPPPQGGTSTIPSLLQAPDPALVE